MSTSNAAIAAVRNCATAMLTNASFIRHELPYVTMTDVHRAEAEAVCDAFAGSKHDFLSELADLSLALVAGAIDEREAMRRLERINAWMRDTLNAMRDLVRGLHRALDEKKRNSDAYILISESAVNVLTAFRAAQDALAAMPARELSAHPSSEPASFALSPPNEQRVPIVGGKNNSVGDIVIRETATRLTIERTPFFNNDYYSSITRDKAKAILTAARRRDWKTVSRLDRDLLPWYCPACNVVYGESDWWMWVHFDYEPGYCGHASVRGSCPKGHTHYLAD
jgi:hypothetical protein